MSDQNTKITHSSGNVFADLGLPEPEELLQKADLVIDLSLAIERQRLSIPQVSTLLHLSEAEVNELMREAPEDYSVACLQRYLEIVRGSTAASPSPAPTAICV